MSDTAIRDDSKYHGRWLHEWKNVNGVRHIQEIQISNGLGRIDQIDFVMYAQGFPGSFIEVDILHAPEELTSIPNRTTTTTAMGSHAIEPWNIYEAGTKAYPLEIFQPKLIPSPKVRLLGRRVMSLNTNHDLNINALESLNHRWVLKPNNLTFNADGRIYIVYRVLCLFGQATVKVLSNLSMYGITR